MLACTIFFKPICLVREKIVKVHTNLFAQLLSYNTVLPQNINRINFSQAKTFCAISVFKKKSPNCELSKVRKEIMHQFYSLHFKKKVNV